MTPKKCATLLTLVGYGFVIFSLIWVLTAFAPIDRPARLLIDILDWPLDGLPAEPSGEARWMGAIGAGLTCGLGLMFVLIFAPIIRMNDPVTGGIVRKGALIGVIAWYVVDSSGSVAAGVPSNAVFNAVFLLLIVVPLYRVKFTA